MPSEIGSEGRADPSKLVPADWYENRARRKLVNSNLLEADFTGLIRRRSRMLPIDRLCPRNRWEVHSLHHKPLNLLVNRKRPSVQFRARRSLE